MSIGSQDKKRAALKTKLSQLFTANPEVSYNMNVRSGLFRVAVSEDEVTGFLDGKPIKSIKIEDLDDEIREALENNPEEAGVLIMEELINAHKEGKLAMSESKMNKQAKAGEGDYEGQLSGITERQLEKAGPLYERQDEERKDITEKQLGDKGYKEYEHTARVDEEQKTITEGQLKDGKNPNPDTSKREDDARDSITQKQLDGKEFTNVNSRKDDEKTDITEKQLEKNFRNDEIKGITEKQLAGKEQSNDKVLVRRLSSKEDALTFAKKVAKSTARTIVGKELDTANTIDMLKASVKNFGSQKKLAAKLAQMMGDEGAPQDLDMEAPEDVAGGILSDEEIGGSYDADLIVNVMKSLVGNPKFVDLVNEAMETAEAEATSTPEDEELMDEALDDLGEVSEDEAMGGEPLPEAAPAPALEASSDDEGLVAVEGSLSDLMKAAGKKDLEKTAFEFSRQAAGSELGENMSDLFFETDEENDTYRAIFINTDVANMESEEVQEIMAKREQSRLDKVSSSLNKIQKLAQAMPAGGGIPNAAPAGDMGGGGTTLPPGPADIGMDTPPVESFDTGAGEPGADEMGADNEPSPPGTRCPVCGSDDVDIEKGEFKCNNCESNGDIHISLNVKEWKGTLEDNEGPNTEEEIGLGEGEGEEAPAMGMPMAASIYRINQGLIKEAINSGKGYYSVGEYCPNCGSDNTSVDHVGNGKCFSCSQLYISKIAHKDGEFKGLTIWQPLPVKPDCPDCRAKAAGTKLAKKYSLKTVKTASSTGDPKIDFPYEACISRIAKRYGLNAVALSGDCAGKSLIDCICKKMKSAGRYSQGLAMSLASRLTEKDPMEECVEDQMREANSRLTYKEACSKCEELKREALSVMPEQEEVEYVMDSPMGDENECPFGDGGFGLSYDIDKFDDDTVTLSKEDELLEQISQLLNVMKDYLGDKGIGGTEEVDVALEGNDADGETVDEIIENPEFVADETEFGNEGNEEEENDQVDFLSDENEEENSQEDTNEFEGDEEEENDFGDDDEEEEEEGEEGFGEDDDDEEEGFGEDDDDDDDEEDDNKEEMEEEACNDSMACNEKNSSDEKGEKSAKRNSSVKNKEGQAMDLDKYAREMSGKTIKRYSDSDILKTADTMQINDLLGDRKISDSPAEKEVQRVTSQDTKDVGKYQDGKTMGNEEKFDAKNPDVPERGKGSTMGEGEEMPEGKAKVPAGKGAMGTEDQTVDTDVSTEADGRVASKKTSKKTKTAAEKKVEDPKPIDQSKGLKNQKLKDTMEMGAERETGLTPDTLEEPDVPQDNQLMGPDESKEMKKPSVPAGDGGMGHEDETVGTEVSVETKGTTIAQMEARIKEANVRAERIKLATNLAALELMDGEIAQSDFDTEVSKLATSSVPTLRTLIERYQNSRAKRIAEASKVARKEETVREAKSVGLETPFVIEGQSSDLKNQIMGLFSLEQQIRGFEENK